MPGLPAAMAAPVHEAALVEVRRIAAPEAHQGVAAGGRAVYAIDNSQIARYDKASGGRVALWRGDPHRFKHINSCTVRLRQLVCAASNYPDVPMASRVLWFDAKTLKLQRTLPLKPGHGSLTWLDWHQGSWWAGFANYDGKGGEPGRDHRQTVVVRYTARFAEQAVYRFPERVLERFSPRSASGGVWGSDGLLYVTGHDRPEAYVLRVPAAGTTLEHVKTLATPTGGQAIAWDPVEKRTLWSIERRSAELVASRVPLVD